jgi:ribosomal protein S18 acetylase RimI-like enzyme
MLPDSITTLILDEQARQAGRFVKNVEMCQYLAKLGERAEILADSAQGRCRAVVAYYCNDLATKQAYISLVLVDPRDRGLGLGRALVGCVLDMARQRGFASCRLEVAKDNEAARKVYLSLGFRHAASRPEKDLLEIGL